MSSWNVLKLMFYNHSSIHEKNASNHDGKDILTIAQCLKEKQRSL